MAKSKKGDGTGFLGSLPFSPARIRQSLFHDYIDPEFERLDAGVAKRAGDIRETVDSIFRDTSE